MKRYTFANYHLHFLLFIVSLSLYSNYVVAMSTLEMKVLRDVYLYFNHGTDHSLLDREVCSWSNVDCSSTTVTKLVLNGKQLKGSIPSSICHLPRLEFLDLSRNALSGEIGLSGCHKLNYLNISFNFLSGDLASLSSLDNIEVLDLSYNKLKGDVIQENESLRGLRSLNLSHNGFSGELSSSLGKLNKLEEVSLSFNMLRGVIPPEISTNLGLRILDIGQNGLYGSIPDVFKSFPKLTHLLLSGNKLQGKIPVSLAELKGLEFFAANSNWLSGPLPKVFGSLSNLSHLDLSYNKLTGQIPTELFQKCKLRILDLSSNFLDGKIPNQVFSCSDLERLRIGNNRLTGNISNKMGDLERLKAFEANGNMLQGSIPDTVLQCTKLELIDLSRNRLSGPIPQFPGGAVLQAVNLSKNSLSGSFQESLLNVNLSKLDLSWNRLSGGLPRSIFTWPKLQVLRLQGNNFTGEIPSNVSYTSSLIEVSLSKNKLNGPIPREIGRLVNIQVSLDLSYNELVNHVPVELSKLTKLTVLDISNNRLTGKLPKSLENMQSLTIFDVSNNELWGPIPDFSKFTLVNTNGTHIANISNKHLPNGQEAENRNKEVNLLGIIVAVVVGVGIVLGIFTLICKYHKPQEIVSEREYFMTHRHFLDQDNNIHRECIDFELAFKATLDPRNLIRNFKLSTYFRVTMPSASVYSVKKLKWMERMLEAGNKMPLVLAMEKMASMRHPNIMTPLAYAMNKDAAILIYEDIYECNLTEFIRGKNRLDWSSRSKIALGIVRGVAYLHGCLPPLIPMDISTDNIFLSASMEPQIGDIELCRNGSISVFYMAAGYIPPEYAYTMKMTSSCNVYSIGVILLELLTGLTPIINGMSLPLWVKMTPSRGETWEEILDSRISTISFNIRTEMISMLQIALQCTQTAPEDRPEISDVLNMAQQVFVSQKPGALSIFQLFNNC